jgi:hypothetical protein
MDEAHDNPVQALGMKSRYANLLKAQGKLAQAEPLLRSILETRRYLLGSIHVDTLTAVSDLADLLKAQGKVIEGVALAREVFEGRKATLGPHHIDTITSMNAYAMLVR